MPEELRATIVSPPRRLTASTTPSHQPQGRTARRLVKSAKQPLDSEDDMLESLSDTEVQTSRRRVQKLSTDEWKRRRQSWHRKDTDKELSPAVTPHSKRELQAKKLEERRRKKLEKEAKTREKRERKER